MYLVVTKVFNYIPLMYLINPVDERGKNRKTRKRRKEKKEEWKRKLLNCKNFMDTFYF